MQRTGGRSGLGYSWNRKLSRSCHRVVGQAEVEREGADREEPCRLGKEVGFYSECDGKIALEIGFLPSRGVTLSEA